MTLYQKLQTEVEKSAKTAEQADFLMALGMAVIIAEILKAVANTEVIDHE